MKHPHTSLVCAMGLSVFIFLPFVFAGTQSLGTVTISPSPINLIAGTTKSVTCNATVTDSISWADIVLVNATLWDSSVSSEGASNNNNDHYSSICSLSANTSVTARPVVCSFSLQYYANPSSWTCKIRSYNATADVASNQNSVTVNSLIALNVVETSINFGSLSLGSTSQDVTTILENLGNVQLDTQLSGNNLACNSGSISVGNMHYSATSGTAYAGMTLLSNTPTTLDLNILKPISGVETKEMYWKILVPSSGAGGSCSNTVTFAGVAG